ncbi:MAG: peptidylprolyl isomerase [Lachnospiraceae bacterium]|nr:peptidylprolyl isomerase [Lachnospiraceae bacterium]
MQRKFLFLCAAGILAAGLTFGGCEKKGERETLSPTPSTQEKSPTPKDEGNLPPEERMEPALTDEAKKLYQFEDLSEGETYARIHMKEYGTITVKFFQNEAPLAVENFLTHAKEGYYNGVTFHRVIDDFMIQGGDPDGTGMGGESIWGKYFADEFSEKLHPYRGALCMANTEKSDTNGSQFFIVQADADSILQMKTLLDAEYKMTLKDYFKAGYDTDLTDEEVERYELYGGTPWLYKHHTVFGQVLEGYEVLDAIAGVQTDDNNRPLTSVVIESIEVLEYSADK